MPFCQQRKFISALIHSLHSDCLGSPALCLFASDYRNNWVMEMRSFKGDGAKIWEDSSVCISWPFVPVIRFSLIWVLRAPSTWAHLLLLNVCVCMHIGTLSVVGVCAPTCLEHFHGSVCPRGLRGFCSGAVITGQGSFCPLHVPSAARCTVQKSTHIGEHRCVMTRHAGRVRGAKFQGPTHEWKNRKCVRPNVQTDDLTGWKLLFDCVHCCTIFNSTDSFYTKYTL